MSKALGIDLGTTNSVAAVVDGPQPRVLDNKENKAQTRSAASLRRKKGKEDEILIGDAALKNWPLAPKDTIISIKRLMGRGVVDPEVQKVRRQYLYEVVEPSDGTKDSVRVKMGGKEYPPVEISAMILRKIKADAESRLNGEPVTDAVITVPAYFSQAQKAATRKAGQLAGLRVIKILDEPTAAAIAFGIDSAPSSDPKNILVYDLGGGTFDISILMWAGNVFAPLNLEGDMWLGGDNFDQLLTRHAINYVRTEYSLDPTKNLRFMAELKKAAQDAKESLSSAQTAEITVTGVLQSEQGDLIDIQIEITREEFHRMAKPLVDKSMLLVEIALMRAFSNANSETNESRNLFQQITDLAQELKELNDEDIVKNNALLGRLAELLRRAKEQTRFDEQIDYVLMAGNATNMLLVQDAVEKRFGSAKIKRNIHPKNSVAMGAAKLAAILRERVVCQAPDASDPRRECGEVNPWEATACKKCGVPLKEDVGGNDLIPPGGIAPFSYGVQLAGDKYGVFVKKGEGYPTENPQPQTFVTLSPNQRIVSIPVYGGDNIDKASANEKQGDVYAILPAGKPKGTVVRVKVWLDSDGVFDLSAHLDDGTDLRPLIMKGEGDARAMEALQKVEAEMEKKAKELSPDQMAEAEAIRNKAFQEIKNGRYEQAVALAQKADQFLNQPDADSDPLPQKAEGLIGFAQFVLHSYDWALDASKAYQLNRLVEETRAALISGDRLALERKVKELDEATDAQNLPELLRILLNIRGAINQAVRAHDPGLAANLLEEQERVEDAFKARNPKANEMLSLLSNKVARELQKDRPATADKCSCGRAFVPGELVCPQCKLPRGLLGVGETKASSGFITA